MFDVIIGNPPYQEIVRTEKTAAQSVPRAIPLYHHFIEQARKLGPKVFIFVIPSKWLSGEAVGLISFKEKLFLEGKIKRLIDFETADKFFSNVNIGGGICFLMWTRDHQGGCEIIYADGLGKVTQQQRKLDPKSTYVRDIGCLSIIEKVHRATPENNFMHTRMSSRLPFGLPTFVRPTEQGDLLLRYRGGG